MVEKLIERLHSGGFTLVVAKGDEVRSFNGRGITDIYRLYKDEPQVLCGATIVDKIIGKGAAAIMILSRPYEIYTDVISENALSLFTKYGVKVSYSELTPHIIRRDGNGWCPVELMCCDAETPEECLTKIDQFVKEIITK